MPYEPFVNGPESGIQFSNYLAPDFGAPLDVRCVINKYDDFEDPSFLARHPYIGMLVAVVKDPDNELNGVYYAKADPPTHSYDWVKLDTQGAQNAFKFIAKDYYEFSYIDSETGMEWYTQEPDPEESNHRTTFQNIYSRDGEDRTAEVVVVRDAPSVYHLMIDPLLKLILHGGDAGGNYKVTLNIESPIVKSVQELQGSSIGLDWLNSDYTEHVYNYIHTNIQEADLHWFASYEDALNKQNEIENISADSYNGLDQDGEYLHLWCYATYPDWEDSSICHVFMEIIGDEVSVTITVTDPRRTRVSIFNM